MISGNVFRVGSADDGTLGGLTPVAAVTLTTPHLIVRLTSSSYAYYVGVDSVCIRAAADTYLDVLGVLFNNVTAVTAGTSRALNNMLATGSGPPSLTCTELPTSITGTTGNRRAFYRTIAPGIGNTFRDAERTHYACLNSSNDALALWFISASATGTVTWVLRADRVV